jgi:hypothetical protein
MQCPEGIGQISKLVVGVQATGIGENPEATSADPLRLKPHSCLGSIERGTIRPDAHHCHPCRHVAFDFPFQPSPPSPQFIGCELSGCGSRSAHQVRDPEAILQQHALLPRAHQPRSKSGPMQGRPEAIAGSGEMMPGGPGIKSGVDPAEQHPQSSSDEVRDGASRCCRNLCFGGPGLLCAR